MLLVDWAYLLIMDLSRRRKLLLLKKKLIVLKKKHQAWLDVSKSDIGFTQSTVVDRVLEYMHV